MKSVTFAMSSVFDSIDINMPVSSYDRVTSLCKRSSVNEVRK